jgi:hypothetical protein
MSEGRFLAFLVLIIRQRYALYVIIRQRYVVHGSIRIVRIVIVVIG